MNIIKVGYDVGNGLGSVIYIIVGSALHIPQIISTRTLKAMESTDGNLK